MPVHNSEIAEMFEEVADLLEIEGANEFRIRAYRNASRVVAGLSKSAADLVADEKALTELPGIGKTSQAKSQKFAGPVNSPSWRSAAAVPLPAFARS